MPPHAAHCCPPLRPRPRTHTCSHTLAAGLLHDTVEDCGDAVGLEEIDFHFGAAVRRIVEGETKFRRAVLVEGRLAAAPVPSLLC